MGAAMATTWIASICFCVGIAQAASVRKGLLDISIGTSPDATDVATHGSVVQQWRRSSAAKYEQDSTEFYIKSMADTIQLKKPLITSSQNTICSVEVAGSAEEGGATSSSDDLALKLIISHDCLKDGESTITVTLAADGKDELTFAYRKDCGHEDVAGVRLEVGRSTDNADVVHLGAARGDWAMDGNPEGQLLLDSGVASTTFYMWLSKEGGQAEPQLAFNAPRIEVHPAIARVRLSGTGNYVQQGGQLGTNPLSITVSYECLFVENAAANLSLSIKVGMYPAVQWRWRKQCGQKPLAQRLAVGRLPGHSDVVFKGATSSNWLPSSPPSTMVVVGPTIPTSNFYFWMEEAVIADDRSSYPIQPPTAFTQVTITNHSVVCSGQTCDFKKGGNADLSVSSPLSYSVTYKCVKGGLNQVVFTAKVDPYRAITFAWLKDCGSMRWGPINMTVLIMALISLVAFLGGWLLNLKRGQSGVAAVPGSAYAFQLRNELYSHLGVQPINTSEESQEKEGFVHNPSYGGL